MGFDSVVGMRTESSLNVYHRVDVCIDYFLIVNVPSITRICKIALELNDFEV